MAKKTARRASKRASTGSRAATVAFAAKHMKKKPDIEMSELKKLGKKAGHNIYPLIIGLARRELGWAKPKPAAKRRTKTAASRRGPGRPRKAGARRGPGRPRKTTSPTDAIQAVIERMRELERENAALRNALSRIADLAG